MQERGDAIYEWPQDMRVSLYGPLADQEETKGMDDGISLAQVQVIEDH